jgi:hypothetical protein
MNDTHEILIDNRDEGDTLEAAILAAFASVFEEKLCKNPHVRSGGCGDTITDADGQPLYPNLDQP